MNMKKIVTTALAMAMVACVSVGGTLAYLQDKTNEVKNTFSYGDVNITLLEAPVDPVTGKIVKGDRRTFNDYEKLVPGQVLDKDPEVTVKAGSEKSYIFLKVVETHNDSDYLQYTIDTDVWEVLPENPGVYYTEVDASKSETDVVLNVITGDKVTVLDTLTKDQIKGMGENKPTINFTAYAIQKEIGDVNAAWTAAKAMK